jgi:hypothetical protein
MDVPLEVMVGSAPGGASRGPGPGARTWSASWMAGDTGSSATAWRTRREVATVVMWCGRNAEAVLCPCAVDEAATSEPPTLPDTAPQSRTEAIPPILGVASAQRRRSYLAGRPGGIADHDNPWRQSGTDTDAADCYPSSRLSQLRKRGPD